MKIKRMILSISLFLAFLFVFSHVRASEPTLSLKFKDAELRKVIQAIGQKAYKEGVKINVLIGPMVEGLVSIDIEKVDWQTALNAVLNINDCGYEWVASNIIYIDTVDNLAMKLQRRRDSKVDEQLETRVYTLDFAEPEKVSDIIRPMASRMGKITYDNRTNSLVVTDTQSNLMMFDETIRALDTVAPQVEIEARILDTSLDLTRKLGVDWNLTATATGSRRPTTFPFGHKSDNKYFRGTDFLPPTADNFAYGFIDTSNLSATLNIIFNDSGTKIVAMPKIATINNNTAKIEVITKDPVPEYNYNTETGNWEINGFEDKIYGVTLEVTPQINKAGYITLTVEPTVSENIGDKDFSSGSGLQVTVPTISTDTALTKVMVKDGQTLVIAGLIKDRIDDALNKVPVLGDIPVLGYLFKHKSKEKQKRNLLIFITPRIVGPYDTSTQVAEAEGNPE